MNVASIIGPDGKGLHKFVDIDGDSCLHLFSNIATGLQEAYGNCVTKCYALLPWLHVHHLI